MIRQFEEISGNAWPALQTMHYDGWILRFAGGVTKRSNSVNLLYPSTINPDEKIDFCESLYHFRQIPPCFKITSIADPPDIDDRLAGKGYLILSTISFQTIDLVKNDLKEPEGIHIELDLSPAWLDEFIRMNAFDPKRKPVYTGIMNQALTPKCLVSIRRKQKTIGVGLGVLEGKYIGIFDIVVDPNHRNSGLGNELVNAILFWGKNAGAETAYLQVLTNNQPALNLYRKMGFCESYQYWYRMKNQT
ncbi:MAG: GNAT family N-acetyltransferase [Bacteroidetes bacterium]|nr:GNAT family N-acetyltransferase [Bacteroidota bacterium]